MRLVFPIALLLTALAGSAQAQGQAQGQGNPSFNLVNRAAEPINQIFATPTGVPRWGQDRLQRFLLPPGRTFPLRLPADGSCTYDIRVVYAGGRSEEKRRVNTCIIDAMAFPGGRTSGQGAPGPDRPNQAAANDPSFRLINRSRVALNEMYVSPSGDDSWGEDRLGDDTIDAGSSFVIRLPHGRCNYDVRAVFDDGEIVERRKVDLCRINDLRLP